AQRPDLRGRRAGPDRGGVARRGRPADQDQEQHARAEESPGRNLGEVNRVVLEPRPGSHRRLLLLCGAVPVIVAALLVQYRPAFLGRLDDSTSDLFQRSARPRPPAPGIVIVDVDERSLSTVGQWPWRRDVVGRLISRLRDAGASAVALDVIFAEPDRASAT